MSRAQDEQAIALAGVFQAAVLVDQIARRGLIPQNCFEASINSIFATNPNSTEDIFGGVADLPYNLDTGLKYALDMSDKKSDKDKDISRYAISLLHLESRLRKHPKMLDDISTGIERIREQARYFEQTSGSHDSFAESADEPATTDILTDSRYAHPNVIAAIASLYQDTLSTFSFRVQVTGEPRHLQNTDNANKIRALLLAGVRSAILWRQVGGKRWQLLLFRSRVGKSARKILYGNR